LRTPGQLALAVIVVAGVGATMVIVVSVLLSVAASSLVGDGSALVRFLLVVFVLGPCVSLGIRCGRWWAFLGAAGLVPLLVFAMLVAGSVSSTGLEFAAVAVLATAFALAVGSLQSERGTRRRRSRVREEQARRSAGAEEAIDPRRPLSVARTDFARRARSAATDSSAGRTVG
jgi:hypothetical protein